MTRHRILIVEDETIVAMDIQRGLQRFGYSVCGVADNGPDAIELIPTASPDLVLMDVQLQGGMDGVETARRIRERFGTPVIFLTAYTDEKTLERAKEAGAFGYLIKPFEEKELHTAISVALQKHQTVETDRKQSAEAVRQSEENFRLLVESVRDYAIYMLDPEGRVVSWNAGAERIKGYTAREVLGRHFSIFYPPEAPDAEQPAELLRAAEREGQAHDQGWRLRRNGSRFWADAVITALRDTQGRLRGFAKVTRDVTRQREAEKTIQERDAALELANRSLAKLNRELEERVQDRTTELTESKEQMETFVAAVAHDLRSPLRAMTGFSQILCEKHATGLDGEAGLYLRRITDSAERMGRLLEDLLRYSTLTRSQLQFHPVNLRPVLGEALHLLEHEIRLHNAEISVEDHPPAVLGNPAVLHEVLVNLIANALKFVKPNVRPQIRVHTERRDQKIRVWVEDNGIGIASEYHDTIFGVFRRLHSSDEYPGTGIGLALVHKAVERMGGTVGLESRLGEGSRFWFELPAAKDDAGD